MKAWVLKSVNQLPEFCEVPVPESKEGYSLVNLTASSLNHRDVWITKGKYAGIQLPCVLGSDGAGISEGRRVLINPGWYWGANEDVQSRAFRVLGMPDNGTFAEYISVPREFIHETPPHLSEVEAAALPLAGVTAYRALMSKCHPIPSHKVLVTGAGGGVALFAIQFALALGCEVYVTSGSHMKMDRAIGMGVAGAVNYRDDDWMDQLKKMAGGFDIIIDSAGGDGFRHLVSLSNPGGKIVFYGGTLGNINGLNPQTVFWKQLSIMGSTMGSPRDFAEMLEFVDKHRIIPVVDEVFEMEEWDKAFEKMEQGQQFGKLVCIHS
ncbi:MAG: zinc-binding dehydrogenase [Saprospiraceae bacterium]|nr:zinc-binding dehydrogenase [Saprospiraceae bacterium]